MHNRSILLINLMWREYGAWNQVRANGAAGDPEAKGLLNGRRRAKFRTQLEAIEYASKMPQARDRVC
jgi:hypothetical protein